jgi:Phage integrase, N-terminal SAM-like domain
MAGRFVHVAFEWLAYWLENVVLPNRRPATYRLYEMTIRLYLKPGLGKSPPTRLSASRDAK